MEIYKIISSITYSEKGQHVSIRLQILHFIQFYKVCENLNQLRCHHLGCLTPFSIHVQLSIRSWLCSSCLWLLLLVGRKVHHEIWGSPILIDSLFLVLFWPTCESIVSLSFGLCWGLASIKCILYLSEVLKISSKHIQSITSKYQVSSSNH